MIEQKLPKATLHSHSNSFSINKQSRSWYQSARRILFGLIFSSAIGLFAYRRHSLSKSGVVGAIISGTTIFGMGGLAWGLALIYFFGSSSLLSHFRKREKESAAADKFSKGSQRDLGQAIANGGVATLIALGFGLMGDHGRARTILQAGFVGALATANADTWATELGVLSSRQPRSIVTGKPVAVGTSGGITLLGTSASLLGAFSLGGVFWLLQRSRKSLISLPFIALVSGLAGSFFDSVMGATVQAMYYCPHCEKETERRVHSCGTQTTLLRGISWLNNDAVNFAATAFGAAVAMGLRALFT